jgi:hypothetical protein
VCVCVCLGCVCVCVCVCVCLGCVCVCVSPMLFLGLGEGNWCAGDKTQGCMHARQAFSHWAAFPDPMLLFITISRCLIQGLLLDVLDKINYGGAPVM